MQWNSSSFKKIAQKAILIIDNGSTHLMRIQDGYNVTSLVQKVLYNC